MSDGNNYYVYKHTSPSNKVYIGITRQDPKKRWNYGYGYFYGSNTHFVNAIRKYGWDNFEHEILISGLSEEEAKLKEIELIDFYRSADRRYGYNVSLGGGIPSKESIIKGINTKRENGSIARVAEHTKKLWADPIWRAKNIAQMSGKRDLSDESRQRYADARRRRGTTEETRRKLSQIAKNNIGEKSHRAKRVLVINALNGEIENTYATARDCSKGLGLSINCVASACRSPTKHSHGKIFMYEKDYSKELVEQLIILPIDCQNKSKKIRCVETEEVFESLSKCQKIYGKGVHNVFSGKVECHKGLHFEYV